MYKEDGTDRIHHNNVAMFSSRSGDARFHQEKLLVIDNKLIYINA